MAVVAEDDMIYVDVGCDMDVGYGC